MTQGGSYTIEEGGDVVLVERTQEKEMVTKSKTIETEAEVTYTPPKKKLKAPKEGGTDA